MGLIKTLPICNLAQEEDLVTLHPPNHGRFLPLLRPRFGGVFLFKSRARAAATHKFHPIPRSRVPRELGCGPLDYSVGSVAFMRHN